MAFDLSGFQSAAGAARAGHVPVVHSYRTADSATDVVAANYFDAVATLVAPGDLIYRVTVDVAGAVTAAGFHTVLTVAGGVVTVSPALAVPLV